MPRLQLLEDYVLPRNGQAMHNKLACGHLDQPRQDLVVSMKRTDRSSEDDEDDDPEEE